jgi:hypothetical protein
VGGAAECTPGPQAAAPWAALFRGLRNALRAPAASAHAAVLQRRQLRRQLSSRRADSALGRSTVSHFSEAYIRSSRPEQSPGSRKEQGEQHNTDCQGRGPTSSMRAARPEVRNPEEFLIVGPMGRAAALARGPCLGVVQQVVCSTASLECPQPRPPTAFPRPSPSSGPQNAGGAGGKAAKSGAGDSGGDGKKKRRAQPNPRLEYMYGCVGCEYAEVCAARRRRGQCRSGSRWALPGAPQSDSARRARRFGSLHAAHRP